MANKKIATVREIFGDHAFFGLFPCGFLRFTFFARNMFAEDRRRRVAMAVPYLYVFKVSLRKFCDSFPLSAYGQLEHRS